MKLFVSKTSLKNFLPQSPISFTYHHFRKLKIYVALIQANLQATNIINEPDSSPRKLVELRTASASRTTKATMQRGINYVIWSNKRYFCPLNYFPSTSRPPLLLIIIESI